MISMRPAILFALFGVLLASPAGSPHAEPDKTLGMALLSANVSETAELLGGAGAVSSAFYPGTTAVYVVKFNRNLTGCTCAAMGMLYASINITAQCPSSTPDTVIVQSWATSTNQWASTPFHLLVFCPK